MVNRKLKSDKEIPGNEEVKDLPAHEPKNAKNDTQESNDSLEDTLKEVVDYAIIKLDETGTIKSWNKGAENIKGYTASEIIGKNYRIFYTSEDRDQHLSEKLLAEAKEHNSTNYEGWRVRKDGSRFWGSMCLTALHNDEGKLKGYLKLTRDLTDKKKADDRYSNFVEELRLKNEDLKKSEERYHKMVSEVLDYSIILLDQNGLILDWNKGAEKMKGYTAPEIIGKHFRLFYPKEEKDFLPDKLLQLAAKNGSALHDGWRVKKNGERFWGSIVITALHDETGNLIGFSKVTRDLTARKIAEDKVNNLLEELHQLNDALKKSEERYHKMIAEVQDYAIILLDINGNIENWNAGAQFIKGYTPEEIIGKNFKTFYSTEDQMNGLPDLLLEEARQIGKVAHDGWRIRKDGSKFWGSVVITALHDENNKVIAFSKVTRDLTEKKKVEESLRYTAAELDLKTRTLERVNSELSSFTYVASHDLKEPLRKIKTFAARIKDVEYSPEKIDLLVEKITGSASKMQSLIENLLAYSQVSNDEVNFEEVDLNGILESVKNDLEVLISEKHATIESENLPTVYGISFHLYQLFLNLISNSIKFTKENEPPFIKILSTTTMGNSNVEPGQYYKITFSDRGMGFPQGQADKIFEAFHRIHKKGPIAGSGIGLAIVKKIVENHQGTITAEGSVGEGAVFTICLPIQMKASATK